METNKMTHIEKIMHNDTAVDHPTHDTYREDCSRCFTENMIIHQKKVEDYEITNRRAGQFE